MRTVAISIVSLISSLVISTGVYAYDGSIDITACPTVSVVVGNVDTASGWGGHISTDPYSNGYGGSNAECHLTGANVGSGEGDVMVLCYDGYLSPSDHVDQYELHLGSRDKVKQVEFKVTNRGVFVEVLKHSVSGFTDDENDYVVTGFFPFREASSFCRENTLYYEIDGVLSQTSSRDGSGYSVNVSVSP